MSGKLIAKETITKTLERGDLILGKGQYYSKDGIKTQLNNNVLVVGTSGAGKTRSIVMPNLLQADGSYVVSDPKGSLSKGMGPYLESLGYKVIRMDFIHPERSTRYNPLAHIRNTRDIQKLAHNIVYEMNIGSGEGKRGGSYDPFWDKASEMLITSILGYVMENDEIPVNKKNLITVKEYIKKANRKDGNSVRSKSEMDELMYRHKLRMAAKGIESWAATRYDDYNCSPDKTHQTINITSISNFSMIDTLETRKMVCGNDIYFEQIGNEPTVVFVEVCDSDRSMDFLVNLFYSQLMNALCDYADNYCENSRLPVPVQFILDDFATNARIDNFQNMIANIRSRGISAMIMVQSESQLKAGYDEDAKTIVDNCNSYVYMGGMDTELTKDISIRADKPSKYILNMPIGYSWIFRRGQEPVYCRNFDIEAFMQVKGFEYGKPAKFSYDLLDEISSERRGA